MQAVDMLVADFLSLIWSENGRGYSALNARLERHCSALDAAGPLPAHVVMYLFASLEQRAIHEISTWSALTQTTEPDAIVRQRPDANVPPEALRNIHTLHQYLPKAAHSKQAKDAASAPRPGGHHPDRQRIKNEFKKLTEVDPDYFKVPENKTFFINDMLETFPNISKTSAYKWVKEWLKE